MRTSTARLVPTACRLLLLVWLAAHALFAPDALAAQRVLRIATIVPEQDTEARRGLEFGAAEAKRTGALFGWDVQAGAEVRGAHAIVVVGDTLLPISSIPVIRIAPAAVGQFFLILTGTRDSVAWRADLERFGAQQLNDRYRSATGQAMSPEAWGAWFAIKALLESAMRARSSATDRLVHELHDARPFDGHKGEPLRFDDRGRLLQPMYPRP